MMTVIALHAKDWSGYDEQYAADAEFDLMRGWVVGVLLREDDEKIVIAHHWFMKDKQVRHVTVVQKSCIVRRVEFKVKSDD